MYPYASLELHSFLLCEADAVVMGKAIIPHFFYIGIFPHYKFDKVIKYVYNVREVSYFAKCPSRSTQCPQLKP